MDGFFNNPYMLYGDEENLNPDAWWQQDVYAGGGGEEQDPEFLPRRPQAEPTGPMMVPPQLPDQSRPQYQQYLEHLKGLPIEQNSTWDKIFSGIAGVSKGILTGDPMAGAAMYQKTLHTPYERALEEWKTKGTALGESAGLEEKDLARDMDYAIRTGQLENASRANEIRAKDAETRATQAQNNYDVAKKRLEELHKQGADKKAIADATNELNKQKLKVDQYQAESQRIQAEAARSRASSYGEYMRNPSVGGSKVVPPDITDLTAAEGAAARELYGSFPNIRKFFDIDEETGDISYKMDQEWTPEEFQERERILQMIGNLAQQKLGGQAVGGAPWRPPVVIPPNRRRMP